MDISCLNSYDYIFLKATFTNYNDSYFQCRYNESKFKGRTDEDLLIKIVRQEKGCFVIKDEPVVEMDNDVEFYSCLCHPNFQHPDYPFYYDLYKNYKNGILPYEGNLMDQPAKIMDAINYIESLHIEKSNEDNKKPGKS